MTGRVTVASVRRVGAGASASDQDLVAVESPLGLVIEQPPAGARRQLGLLMRTPGDDRDLVTGLLYSEGVISAAGDLVDIAFTSGNDDIPETAIATLAPSATTDALPDSRALHGTSACGLCGRLALPSSGRPARMVDAPEISPDVIAALPAQLRRSQAIFDETGGLHAAAVFDTAGTLQLVREDVGRHNAVDKAIGALVASRSLPAAASVLVVSGRVAYEIVQKASMAGFAAVVAVGAPSSLAVQAARAASLTLVGFARDGRFNVYAGAARIRA